MDWTHQTRIAARLSEAEADLAATKPGTWGHTTAQRLVTRHRNALKALTDKDAAEMRSYRSHVAQLRREGAIPPEADEEPV